MNISKLLEAVKKYNKEECVLVKRAYEFAKKAHQNQKRESGEPYIIHPLYVAYYLTGFYADGKTLCAGLLHDVVEDTSYTLEDIEKNFGLEVSHLVEGVTKINNLHFTSKNDATNANIRRLINSLNDDVRIIIIKLCDRLHNMKTLEFKPLEKQIRSAEETLNIFVPIAYFIGAFRLKCELEDICFYYINKEDFLIVENKREEVMLDYKKCIKNTEKEIKNKLKEKNIKFNIRTKIINNYHLYKKLNKGLKLNEIHDLVNCKIIVKEEETCYQVLGLIHKLFTPMNNKFKDYIACPKTNMYRSLHTTVFAKNNHILQIQIKTEKMDDINTFGLAGYWKQEKENGKKKMQEELKNNYQFFNTLHDLNEVVINDQDFMDRVKREIFTNNIYVYTFTGEVVELPEGATVIDFAYKIHTDVGNHLSKAFINGEEVKLNQVLNNKDRILLIKKEKTQPKKEWLTYAKTSNAKRKIKESLK